ncbi:MAG: ABC transporter permease [Spirochaetales bacterium]|nr:ABC transporter permease [Spirochaetales bacterium]
MIKIINSIMNDIKRAPGKTILTLLTVALGVGILSIALSISGFLNTMVAENLEKDGLLINFSNGEFTDTGVLEKLRPSETDQNILTVLETDLDGFVGGSPVFTEVWSDIKIGTEKYQIRNILGTSEEYFNIMELELLFGSFFTSEDVASGTKKAVISSSLASQLFGSPDEAIGKVFSPPSNRFMGRGGENNVAVETFVIQGVFEDPDEFVRTSYQTADLIIPLTSVFPAGMNISRMLDMVYATGIIKVEGYSLNQAESLIRQSLSAQYGDDITLTIWEGSPEGDSSTIQEARRTVSTFSIVVNILGIVLLLTGSIGILSIMMIEALGRTREIAIERALGASKIAILREFFNRSLMLTSISIILGLILAVILIQPFAHLLNPVFTGIGITGSSPGLTPGALAVSIIAALLAGGFFGVIPVSSLMKGSISDTIREG